MIAEAKKRIKGTPSLRRLSLWALRVADPVVHFGNLRALPRYVGLVSDWLAFRRAGGKAAILDFYPCLFDNTPTSGIDTHYFHQAVWAFRNILRHAPSHHVDIGSAVGYVGMLSTITKVIFVDIRPLSLRMSGYTGIGGSILDLPFEDSTVSSLSSLHVIEHVGLGRYGDPIDPQGSAKACKEVVRVLSQGGVAYIAVPIGESRVQFNGQRVFSVYEVLAMFNGLQLIEFSMVNARGHFYQSINPAEADIGGAGSGLDFGLGLFQFKKGV